MGATAETPGSISGPRSRAGRLLLLRGLYAIVDSSAPHPPLRLVEAFLAGGARVIQLRLKRASAGELLRVSREAVARCARAGALCLVNDRPDVAWLAGADGVHLGQDDLPLAEARRLLGPEALIGLSTHGDDEIDAGVRAGADYLGFGPVFATATKGATAPGAAPLPPPHGLQGLRRAVLRAGVPLVAIGGITAERAAEVAATGAACAAAIAWLGDAPDPQARAAAFAQAVAYGVHSAGPGAARG